MVELLNQLQEVVQNNQILTTIAGGSVIVWLVSNIKSLFFTIIDFITSIISFNITNYYEDNRGADYLIFRKQRVFNNMLTVSKAIWERTKNLDLSNHTRTFNPYLDRKVDCPNLDEKNLLYGFSIRWFMGSLCVVHRHVKNDAQKIVVTTNIRVFFSRKKKFLAKLDEAIEKETKVSLEKQRETNTTKVYTADSMCMKYKRHIDSIFTNNNEHKDLLVDIEKFIANRKVYECLNYPYKYSALIHGKPGCGKSSTILSIASALKRDIKYINMSAVSSGRLMDMMNDNASEFIFVFEDIDAITKGTSSNRDDSNDESKPAMIREGDDIGCTSIISLADLLNITDGLLSSDGSICIFTTNHIERLDPALLRAGRMNKIVEFTYLNPDTANRMIKTYLGTTVDNLQDVIKPAELQEEILQIKLGRSTIDELKKKFTKND